MQHSRELGKYLVCDIPDKQWILQKIIHHLDDEGVIPAFSSSIIKLGRLTRDPGVSMEDIKEVIEMDPGLSSDCIQIASTVGFAARRISSIKQALMYIGIKEIQRIAFTVGVMKKFDDFKEAIDWDKFWLHSVLVARLTEKVAGAYRQSTGAEYLAGLLHDCGKLFLERFFPDEFSAIVVEAQQHNCGHVLVEKKIIGVTHAQIGGAICESLQAHIEVIWAVWHHHGPFNVPIGRKRTDNSKFLAACVSVGDALANYTQANIAGARVMDENITYDQLPEWKFLSQYRMAYGLDLDLEAELSEAHADMMAFNA